MKPNLYIKIGRWDKKNIVEDEYKLQFEMYEWSLFKSINKICINHNNILYIIIDGHDFVYVDNYIENIDKLDGVYLRLFL
jgi:hypothetical protein